MAGGGEVETVIDVVQQSVFNTSCLCSYALAACPYNVCNGFDSNGLYTEFVAVAGSAQSVRCTYSVTYVSSGLVCRSDPCTTTCYWYFTVADLRVSFYKVVYVPFVHVCIGVISYTTYVFYP